MSQSPAPGPLSKFFALLGGAILLLLGLMFSVVLFSVVAVVGLAAFGFFWWKTRELRRRMREQATEAQAGGQVFEGEAVVVEEYSGSEQRSLSDKPDSPGSDAR